MTDVNELRELGNEDLQQRHKDLDDQIFRLRLQQTMGQGATPNKARELRRDRARVNTLLRERELAASEGEQ
jgi:large subunit ribosomal protein L29